MENRKASTPKEEMPEEKDNKSALKQTLKESRSDPSVKDALLKEKQPATPDDLSPVHNTKEIGTTGGDQRSSVEEQTPAPGIGSPLKENLPGK